MNNIVERLRRLSKCLGGLSRDDCLAAADLIESQAKRIAELEAELEANLQQRVRMQHTINQYESGDKVSKYYACPDCAALRQKIEDAPVVAWQDETGFISACSGGGYFRELIRKEDLK